MKAKVNTGYVTQIEFRSDMRGSTAFVTVFTEAGEAAQLIPVPFPTRLAIGDRVRIDVRKIAEKAGGEAK